MIVAERRARAHITDEGRICHTCGEWKPWDRIAPDKRRDDGKGSNCLDCAHWRTVKAYYGITRTEWEWLLASQNGTCTLCGEEEPKRLAIDHDHTCCRAGRACKQCIRGMLCGICNRMLGHVEAKPALAARFADYLGCRPFLVAGTVDGAADHADAAPEVVEGTERLAG